MGVVVSTYFGLHAVENAKTWHNEKVALACAKDALHKKFYADLPRDEFERRIAAKRVEIVKVADPDLKDLGCSDWSKHVTVSDIINAPPPGEFSSMEEFWPWPALGLALSLSLALFVYGVVRAIGWVLGGFAAS